MQINNQALQQIATDMNTVKEIFGAAITNGKIDYRCASIEVFANRAGALADRSIQTLGGSQVRGSFEEWFED